MPWGAVIGAGIGLLGSSMQADAAQAGAQANVEAARIAAEAQKFRPVGVTTRFGTSNFTVDPSTGNLVSAGYSLSPEVAAMRDRLLSQAGTSGLNIADQTLAAQQGLFNLGNKYLAQSPEEAAQQWMTAQQAVLAPSRQKTLADIRQGLFNTGRGGLSVAQGGDLAAANPELSAYYNSLANQDLQLAAQAQQQGMNQTKFGAGLFGTGLDVASAGYNPFKQQFGTAQSLESAGQGALDLGVNLGGKSTQAAANAADTLYRAQTNANNMNSYSPWGAMLTGAAGNRQLISGISNLFGNWNSGPFTDVGGMGAASNDVLGQWGII